VELWFFLVWNSHPKRVKQPIANPIKRLFYKSNGIQVARIRAEAKGRDERKHTLDARIYPVVRIATAHLHPRCWSTHEEYRFPAIKSLPWTQSRSPWCWFPLREIVHEGGVSVPPHNIVDAAPHQTGGSLTCRRATNAPRRPAHWNTSLVHSRTSHKAQHLALTLSKKLILALSLTKLVLSLRIWSICTWVGLEMFLGVGVMFLNSSNLKMPGRWHIYI